MRRFVKGLAATVTIIIVTGLLSNAHAFDNKRKGFILGFGFGPGYISADHTVPLDPASGSDEFKSSETNGGLSTNFKIGAGLSDQFMLYYVSQATWFSSDGGVNIKSRTVSPGMAGLGASYYLDPSHPSLYFHGGAGVGSWIEPSSSGDARTGFGAIVGLGYEFRTFWHFEATLFYASVDDDAFKTDMYAVSIVFAAIGY